MKILKLSIICFLLCGINQAFALNLTEAKNSNYRQGNFSLNAQNDLKVKSRKQATVMVKQRYNARVINVVPANNNGSHGYRAKLLGKDGTVFYVFVNAKTGKMSKS